MPAFWVDLSHDVLKVVALLLVVAQEAQASHAGQFLMITLVVAAIDLDELAEAFQPGQPHGRADLAHLAVGADVDHAVQACEAKVLHQPDAGSQRIVVGGYGAPLGKVLKNLVA